MDRWLDGQTHARVVQALDALAEGGPGLGRPLVDTIHGSSMANLLDPWRCSILLVAGDKAGRWNEWYREAIPLAERRFETYVKERAQEEGGQP
ncbi:MAG TPA: type II toxin-antitoxin system RelE/ParE family toxin [Streptomyces sp.]